MKSQRLGRASSSDWQESLLFDQSKIEITVGKNESKLLYTYVLDEF